MASSTAARETTCDFMPRSIAPARGSGRSGLEVGRRQTAQQLFDGGQALLRRLELPAEFQLVRAIEPVALRVALDQLQQFQRLDLGSLREAQVAALGRRLDLGDAELLGQ